MKPQTKMIGARYDEVQEANLKFLVKMSGLSQQDYILSRTLASSGCSETAFLELKRTIESQQRTIETLVKQLKATQDRC